MHHLFIRNDTPRPCFIETPNPMQSHQFFTPGLIPHGLKFKDMKFKAPFIQSEGG